MNLENFACLHPASRDAAYDNTSAVHDSAQQLAAFETRSQLLLSRAECMQDVRYGPAERQLLDYFPGDPGMPTVLFIHGGYWQMRHKNTFRFVAEGALAHGLHAALIGYTLAPQASLSTILQEIFQGIAAVRAQALSRNGCGDILLCGWSAGAHLAALGMNAESVVAGLGISGIYDLRPIRLTWLNDALRLSDDEVARLSPCALPASDKPFVTAYGTAELSQLQAQSVAFADHRHGMPGTTLAIDGADHFSILNALADPQGVLLRALQTCTHA